MPSRVSSSLNLDRALGPQAPVGTANPGGGLSISVPDFLFKTITNGFRL
jgi:hypothetical protein